MNNLPFQGLFPELLNQYQACLYLFECISHAESKYVNEIKPFWYFRFVFDFLIYLLCVPPSGQVDVILQEVSSALFRHMLLYSIQHLREPFKGIGIGTDPEEIDFLQFQDVLVVDAF